MLGKMLIHRRICTLQNRSKNSEWFNIAYFALIFLIVLDINTANAQIVEKFECRSNGCCDEHEWCSLWGSIGECDNSPTWMAHNCKLTCKTCSSVIKHPHPKIDQPVPKPPKMVPKPTVPPVQEKHVTPPTVGKVSFVEETTTEQHIPKVITTPKPKPAKKKHSGNNAERCKEIKDSQVEDVILRMINEGLVNDHEDVSFKTRPLSLTDIFQSNTKSGCAPKQDFTDCNRNICYNLRYRTIDGTCNNFQNPFFGAAATAYLHHKTPIYDDGVQALTGSIRQDRPSAREVSRFLLSSSQMTIAPKWNTLIMQFGQFIVHDITKTSLLGTDGCTGCTVIEGRCIPIVADRTDPRFGCSNPPCCLAFSRAATICGTGTADTTRRVQLNENTAYLDGSMIYGSSVTDNDRLRDGAFLRTTNFNGHDFLPFNQNQCSNVTNCAANFDAGDNRITLVVGLGAMHTLFLREHNRIAAILQRENPLWTKDRTFQETRKIVGAELQAIAYKEWLPKVLGTAFAKRVGPYRGYDENVDPSIASEFAHAAMRFGHGMIQESFKRIDEHGHSISAGDLKFEDMILRPQRLLFEGGVDAQIRGMMAMRLKRPQRVTPSVTEKLFGSSDLVAINLQRGRDVGLPSYNEWREFCGLKKARTFDDLSNEITDSSVRTSLADGYKTPDTIDLYAATLLEDHVKNGLIGPTPACIVGNQFKRIRDGDRFWYQNAATFTPKQLAELERVTLSRIICDNGDHFKRVPPKAFEFPTGANKFVSCSSIAEMDLSVWKE